MVGSSRAEVYKGWGVHELTYIKWWGVNELRHIKGGEFTS